MKDSQIRVCGRAAQTDSGAGGAVMFGCLAAAAVARGIKTAAAPPRGPAHPESNPRNNG